MQGRQTVGAPGTTAGQSLACQSSWGRGWPGQQGKMGASLSSEHQACRQRFPPLVLLRGNKGGALHCILSALKEANQTQGWEQSVQPVAMCTGRKDSYASRRHPDMEGAMLPQEDAVSPWAPQDTHWPQGSADTVAAGRTGEMTHSENRSSRLFLSPSGRRTVLGLGNTALAPVSVS